MNIIRSVKKLPSSVIVQQNKEVCFVCAKCEGGKKNY